MWTYIRGSLGRGSASRGQGIEMVKTLIFVDIIGLNPLKSVPDQDHNRQADGAYPVKMASKADAQSKWLQRSKVLKIESVGSRNPMERPRDEGSEVDLMSSVLR